MSPIGRRPGAALVAWTGGLLLALLAWGALTRGVPILIRGAYSGTIPFLGRFMPGRGEGGVEGYLETWAKIAPGLVVVAWTLLLVIVAGLLARHSLRRSAGDPAAAATPARTTGRMLLTAAWIGLLTGVGEAWYYVLRVFFQGRETPGVIGISQHAVWMSPFANLLVFLLAGALLLLAARLLPRVPPRTWIGILLGLAAVALLMVTGRIHILAAVVLGLGVALQASRQLSPGAGEVWGMVRGSMPALVGLIVVAGVTVPVLEVLRERRQLVAAGPAPAGVPNVLFIVLDTERAASTSLHGGRRPTTPVLEQLAREGLWFQRAITPAPWTLPTHGAMFTGRDARALEVDWNTPLDDRFPVLAEVLTDRGYATAGFVANTKYLSDLYGLDRGFGRWEDQPLMPGTVIIHSWLARHVVEPFREQVLGDHQTLRRVDADRINSRFLHWLDHREARPFFAFLNYFDAHNPYRPPPPWPSRFTDQPGPYWVGADREAADYTPEEMDQLLTAYESSIAYLDDRLGALMAALEERGLQENTLVIVTADHGEEFGEQDGLGHGGPVAMPVVHVPLVIAGAGIEAIGGEIAAPVEVHRIPATILDLTGEPDPRLGGESLAELWQETTTDRGPAAAYSREGRFASVVTDSMQFVMVNGGGEQLYQHRRDPLALVNLVDDPAYAGLRDSLRAQLEAWLRSPPD